MTRTIEAQKRHTAALLATARREAVAPVERLLAAIAADATPATLADCSREASRAADALWTAAEWARPV